MSSDLRSSSHAKRICQVIQVKSEHFEEYKKLHKNVWPGVLAGLRRANIMDYSIHFYPSASDPSIAGLLIATFKYIGVDFEADMKRCGEDEETRNWWKVTDMMQQSLVEGATGSESGNWWKDCEEVFRFDG